MAWFAFLIALVAGVANPFQSATNGELNKHLQQPVWTGMIVYATGLVGMCIVQLFLREPLPTAQAAGVSWWAWTGGVISILSTVAGLTLVQKLGAGIFMGLSISASLLVSVLLDQLGAAGLRHHPATPGRWIGCVLMVAGVWLIARS